MSIPLCFPIELVNIRMLVIVCNNLPPTLIGGSRSGCINLAFTYNMNMQKVKIEHITCQSLPSESDSEIETFARIKCSRPGLYTQRDQLGRRWCYDTAFSSYSWR